MRYSCRLLITLIGLSLVGLAGCQHATDEGGTIDEVETAEQASETNVILRVPTQAESSYLHFGFHPELGWSVFDHDEPVETVSIDREMAQRGASAPLDSEIQTAVQGQNNDGDDETIFGAFAGDTGGPTFSGTSGVAGLALSGRSPGSSNFTARSPGASASNGSVFNASATDNRRYSATASSNAGQVCSLRSLCDFTQAVCEVSPESVGGELGCGSIGACYTTVDRSAAQVSGNLTRAQICQVSTLFDCAARAIRQFGSDVGGADGRAFVAFGSIVYCAQRAGLRGIDTGSESGN